MIGIAALYLLSEALARFGATPPMRATGTVLAPVQAENGSLAGRWSVASVPEVHRDGRRRSARIYKSRERDHMTPQEINDVMLKEPLGAHDFENTLKALSREELQAWVDERNQLRAENGICLMSLGEFDPELGCIPILIDERQS